MKNIDLSQYKLVSPESIEKVDGFKKLIDIEVEDDHTFYIKGENDMILSHNCDGSSIAALLINFLYKYWPELFINQMIYRVETPIVVSQNVKNKKKINFYNQEEYNNWLSSVNTKEWIIKYKKGLAALSNDEYEDIILKPRLISILNDDYSKQSLNIWFGKDSELRKTELLKLQ
jgi:DNA gyrase/topoisomerase IV subunit B